MEERVNKFKPLTPKQAIQITNQTQKTVNTNESKLYSNSQTKPFIRKPVVKRHGFASPNIIKRSLVENEELKSPGLLKSKKAVQNDSHSQRDYWQIKQKSLINNKITIKRHTSDKQEKKAQNQNTNKILAIKQAYFGNDMHAFTDAGEVSKGQSVESDLQQKDLCLKLNINKKGRQNIVANSLNLTNNKKVTRTQYFQNQNNLNNQEVRSNTSRSMKDKQINFLKLRKQKNSNQAYIQTLEFNIRKLEKQNYTINKKCKWMHEQVQMHLQKQHLMISQIKGYQLQLKVKQNQIDSLKQQKIKLKNQLFQVKSQLQKKQLIKSKSIKQRQTISSLKQLPFIAQDKPINSQQKFENLFISNYSRDTTRQKNKKNSFKTYPGVCSPKKRNQQSLKCSSISGNNQSFQQLAQSSIHYQLQQKSNVRNSFINEKIQSDHEDILKQKDQLRLALTILQGQIKLLKQKNQQRIELQNQQFLEKLHSKQEEMIKLKNDLKNQSLQKNGYKQFIDCIQINHKNQVQALNIKIKQLQDQLETCQKPDQVNINISQFKDIQFQNPLKFLNEQTNKRIQIQNEEQNFQAENKSLRLYIQNILQHYKYIKIQNRMLLKVKQDLQKIEKQKKQLKQQRDMFKKKLLENVKNKGLNLNNNRKKGRLTNFDSSSSEQQQSAVFQLSQSQILHTQSDIKGSQQI